MAKEEETVSVRKRMVEQQIAERGVLDPYVLDAMRRVPRERFVAPALRESAYDDAPLPIAKGQTISQPYVVALMIEAASLKASDRVLEIGTGSGYSAAVMSRIAAHVDTVERHRVLAESAVLAWRQLGYDNIDVHVGDGTEGWPAAAPYDAILATAGGPAVPDAMRDQLMPGGRLIMPVGDRAWRQRLIKLTRRSESRFDRADLGAVMFVPLIGRYGWNEDVDRIDDSPPPSQHPPTTAKRPH